MTEEVTGIDLVQVQIRVAAGASLDDLGLLAPPAIRGSALQLRVNTERIEPDGSVRPSSGTLRSFDLPSGPGVRTDTAGYAGYTTAAAFDSLLAKIVVHSASGGFENLTGKSLRALRELRVEGIATNQSLLERLLRLPRFRAAPSCTPG